MSRRLPAVLLATVAGALAAGVVLGAAPASAAPEFVATSRTAVLGDVTGDGLRDRAVLGRAAGGCVARVNAGVVGGGFATTATTLSLPVRRAAGAAVVCPDLGVVLPGPLAAANRLAVTWSGGAMGAAPNGQVFRLVGGVATYSVGFAGQDQPSSLASRDLDGDGYGDVYESTDQGEGFAAFLVRTATSRVLYRSPSTAVAAPRFVDLDHGPGVDILLTTDAYPSYHASAVAVDGRTGTASVLASSDDGSVLNYRVDTVELDRDGYRDLRVTSVPDPYGGPAAVTRSFLNRTQDGAFTFVPTGS